MITVLFGRIRLAETRRREWRVWIKMASVG